MPIPSKEDLKKYPFGKIEPNSSKYFVACMLGGVIACGPTHTSVTPLDLVKTRRQVDPKLYSGNFSAWKSIYSKEGIRGVFFGWSPTFVGYSFQGLGKYGFYEVFKHEYGDNLFPNANKTLVYLGASASAEFLADILLCPWEAIKVRMQTTIPPYASNLREGWSKVVAKEGIAGLYKGITPLWGRQIPYTMCKFASFEETVKLIYRQLGQPKESYGKVAQTGVSFLAGYIAGIACAVVSHPADVMVSKLNADRQPGESAGKAMGRIYGNIGFSGLWNGLPTRIVMIGTLVGSLSLYVFIGSYANPRTDRLPVAHLRLLQGISGSPDDRWPLEHLSEALTIRTGRRGVFWTPYKKRMLEIRNLEHWLVAEEDSIALFLTLYARDTEKVKVKVLIPPASGGPLHSSVAPAISRRHHCHATTRGTAWIMSKAPSTAATSFPCLKLRGIS